MIRPRRGAPPSLSTPDPGRPIRGARSTGTSVAVIGGGITGLAAAHSLSEAGYDVVLLEASERLGGKLRTETVGGNLVETGADSFLIRDDELLSWLEGFGVELVEPAVFQGAIVTDERLRPFPRGTVFGLPASPVAALRARPLSIRGRIRALGDLFASGPLRGPDVSVGAFVEGRFGPEVLQRLVDPLLAGTRAGSPAEMSLAAALPQVDAAARRSKSFMRSAPANGHGPKPRFVAPSMGMSALAAHLGKRLPDVRLGVRATAIRSARGRYVVEGDAPVEVDGVVVAVPAPRAAGLVEPLSPSAAARLRRIRHASVASIAIAFSGEVGFPSGTSGMLVPSPAQATAVALGGTGARTLSAATWWSRKWPHTGPGPVVRAFVGRAGRHPALDLADNDLVAVTLDELTPWLGPLPPVAEAKVTRWNHGLPQYRVGHLDLVAAIADDLSLHPGVVLAGADLRGSGVADCHRQGTQAASHLHQLFTQI